MNDNARRQTTVIEEPEVLPPEGEPRRADARRAGRRFADAFGPLAAAILVDAVDFLSFGQVGLVVGMFVGGTLAYVFASLYNRPVWQCLLWALAAGLYGLMPRTQLVPLATIVVALSQYWRSSSGARGSA